MAADLQLRSRAPDTGRRGDCVFCGRPCGPEGSGVRVWYGGTLRGTACADCLSAGPAEAARHLHRRAVFARGVAERSVADDPAGRWNGLRDQLARYAEELEALAATVAGRSAWPPVLPPG